jgi:Domain of unknown function (DUF5665)
MDRYDRVKESKKQLVLNNFIGGISWAFGAIVGVAIVVSLLGLILKHVNLIPYVGNFVAQVLDFVVNKNPGIIAK